MAKTSVYYRKVETFLSQEHVQAYTMAILSFFALAFFTIVAIRPTLISFFELQKEIKDAERTNTLLDEKINNLLLAQNAYYEQLDNIALLDQAIPANPEFTALLKKTETIVDENNATITNFETVEEFDVIGQSQSSSVGSDTTIRNSSPIDKISAVKFNLGIVSSYDNGESAIKQLMNLRRMLLLDTLSIDLANNENPAVGVQIIIDAGAAYHSTFE